MDLKLHFLFIFVDVFIGRCLLNMSVAPGTDLQSKSCCEYCQNGKFSLFFRGGGILPDQGILTDVEG